jgi:anti-anti-sigma regulatory factor
MGIKVATESGLSSVSVDGELTIYTVSELKESFLPLFKNNKNFEINLAAVTEVDGAGVQFLMALKSMSAKADDMAIKFVAHSEPVVDALELLDLSVQFADPVLISAENSQ